VLLKRTAEENIIELRQLAADCLGRAGLSELNEKLTRLGAEKKQ